MEHVGVVNKIIPFSAVDGLGCRTAVFFKAAIWIVSIVIIQKLFQFVRNVVFVVSIVKQGQ